MNPVKKIRTWWRTRKALQRIEAEEPAYLIYDHPMVGHIRIKYSCLQILKADLLFLRSQVGSFPCGAEHGDNYYDERQLRQWAAEATFSVSTTLDEEEKDV